jgi:hypothetical protein
MSKAKNRGPFARRPNTHSLLQGTLRRLGRVYARGGVLVAVLACVTVGGPAGAEIIDRWQPLPSVGVLDNIVLRIHWFGSSAELREAAKNSGQAIKDTDLKGFSFLKRNTQTGEYVCDVYVVKMAGGLVDRDRTTTFGHEVLHCLGLHHD